MKDSHRTPGGVPASERQAVFQIQYVTQNLAIGCAIQVVQ